MAGDVFISYSSKETDTAKLISKTLEKNGISCWMAPESIPSESNYTAEISKEISECKVFLLVLSNSSQKSYLVLSEVNEAINRKKIILPFQIEDCKLNDAFNFVLNQIQRITAYLELESSLKELVERIKREIGLIEEKNIVTETIEKEKIVYPNEYIYVGEIKNGKKDGTGRIKYINGDVYDGFWKDNLRNGKGKYVWENGSYYEGEWKGDKKEGKGKYVWYDDSYYEGEFKDDERNGKGRMTYKNGTYYEGEWKNGKKEGKGKYVYPDGSYYEGEYKNDEKLEGIYYNSKNRKKKRLKKEKDKNTKKTGIIGQFFVKK